MNVFDWVKSIELFFVQTENEEEPAHLNYIRTRLTLQTPRPFLSVKDLILLLRRSLHLAKGFYPVRTMFTYPLLSLWLWLWLTLTLVSFQGSSDFGKFTVELEGTVESLLAEFYPQHVSIQYVPPPGAPPPKKLKPKDKDQD